MSEEMRKEFEEWIIKSNATWRVPNFIMKNDNGAYIDPQTSDLWISWQASREAMKPIKLPDTDEFEQEYWWIGDDLQGDEQCMIIPDIERYADAISEAIQQAGYKVAE